MIQALLGHAKLDTTARYTRVATGLICQGREPARPARATRPSKKDEPPQVAGGPCPVQLWRSRTFSATTAPLGVRPIRATSSLGQLKVMSAIERCRTAALGGHVARCENEDAAHRHRLQ